MRPGQLGRRLNVTELSKQYSVFLVNTIESFRGSYHVFFTPTVHLQPIRSRGRVYRIWPGR